MKNLASAKTPLRILLTTDPRGVDWNHVLEVLRMLDSLPLSVALVPVGGEFSHSQRADLRLLSRTRLFVNCAAQSAPGAPFVESVGQWLLGVARSFRPDVVHLSADVYATLPWGVPVLIGVHSLKMSLNPHNGGRAPQVSGLPGAESRMGARAGFEPKLARIFSAGDLRDEVRNIALLDRIASYLGWPVEVAGECPGHFGNGQRQGAVFLGNLSADALAQRLREAAIYAAPTHSSRCDVGILEAALSGCALVLSDLPELREAWGGGALYLPPDDEAAWCGALSMLIANTAAQEEMGGRARTRAQQLSKQAMAKSYFSDYESMCLVSGGAELTQRAE